jgi:hypothetical protein
MTRAWVRSITSVRDGLDSPVCSATTSSTGFHPPVIDLRGSPLRELIAADQPCLAAAPEVLHPTLNRPASSPWPRRWPATAVTPHAGYRSAAGFGGVGFRAPRGMSLLERVGRMRQEHRTNRIAELADRFAN